MSEDTKTKAINMLKKIVVGIKQDSKFLKDVVVDQTGLKKIESQIVDSQQQLDQVKAKMTMLLQKELQSTRRIKILMHRMADEESQVLAALNDNDEQKAYTLATDLATTELEYQNQLQLDKSFKQNLNQLQSEMEYAERHQKELIRQLSMADTTQRIQKASDVIIKSLNQVDNKQLSAKAALQRIRAQQKRHNENRITASDVISKQLSSNNEETSSRLESAEDVLKRLKDK